MDLNQYRGAPPAPVATSFSVCQQCGISHPPIAMGEKCPMAKDKANDGSVIQSSVFLNQLKTIVIDQIKKKDIKNHQKLFGQVILHVTKFMENYQE